MQMTALAVALAACTSAYAQPLTLDVSGLIGTTLADGSFAGQFISNAALPPQFTVNSASFSFSFADNVDPLITTPSTNNAKNVGNYSFISQAYYGYYVTNYERDVTTFYTPTVTEAGESVTVTLGQSHFVVGSGATASTTNVEQSNTSDGKSLDRSDYYPGYSYSCGNRCSGYSPSQYVNYFSNNYSQITTTITHVNGTFVVEGTIADPALLQELVANRGLGFGLDVQGSLQMTGARLDMDVSPVPEPDSLMLMMGGLGVLGFALRRRK